MISRQHVQHLKKHRNILYGLVLLLLVLQVVSFISMTAQTSKVVAQQDELKSYFEDKIDSEITDTRQELRFSVDELSKSISKQQSDLEQQINLLKSSQDDFSGIVDDAIKGVVSVSTDISAGTGFFVHSGGYIVTNQHVIGSAQNIRIITYDDIILDAQIVGQDVVSDLALLKVTGLFNHLNLEKPENVQVGEKVIAIGNPFGLSFSVSEGIVSAVNRQGPNGLFSYIQTDVSLNPGNSGGPLIDKEGKVIGVNNFKIGGEGLGFSLQADVVREVINGMAGAELIE